MLQSLHVCLGEIIHVCVVSNAGTVGGWVVGSENLQLGTRACRRPECERDEMSFRFVQLADFSAFVRSGSVEVAQTREAQPVGTIVSLECVLEEKFGDAVWIHWLPGIV